MIPQVQRTAILVSSGEGWGGGGGIGFGIQSTDLELIVDKLRTRDPK